MVAANVEARSNKNETIEAAVEPIRAEISRTQAELSQVRSLPPSGAAVKEQIRQEVERLAKTGTPEPTYEGDRIKIYWPDANRFSGAAPAGSAAALMCWLFRDQLLEIMTRGIDEKAGISPYDGPAHTADGRAQDHRGIDTEGNEHR